MTPRPTRPSSSRAALTAESHAPMLRWKARLPSADNCLLTTFPDPFLAKASARRPPVVCAQEPESTSSLVPTVLHRKLRALPTSVAAASDFGGARFQLPAFLVLTPALARTAFASFAGVGAVSCSSEVRLRRHRRDRRAGDGVPYSLATYCAPVLHAGAPCSQYIPGKGFSPQPTLPHSRPVKALKMSAIALDAFGRCIGPSMVTPAAMPLPPSRR
mmetsp:Transcript_13599/g.39204  ORF Transcript_13599/g.39204 Transcript_13599/m.39204 type:complete len:216 (-) Transcript_13599:245-892(-)